MASFSETIDEIDKQRTPGVKNLCAVMEKATGRIEVRVIGVDPAGKVDANNIDTNKSPQEIMQDSRPAQQAVAQKIPDALAGKPAVSCMPAP